MVKYDYAGAAALWDEYYDKCCDPWTLGSDEKQEERRYFMYAMTRRVDLDLYINYINELIDYIKPAEGLKSRCFDFEAEKEYTTIIDKIKSFSGVIDDD